nr:LOW QUALITY PROTEIN: utrophin-like [Dermatophagoides farinae]
MSKQNDLEKKLLAWCQMATNGYEGVQINNFTNSWSDGLAFNALIHHYRPKLFSYGEILSMDTNDRLKHAFEMAAKHFHIDQLLKPDDVNTNRPDKKSVMMYVMCFFQVIELQQQQQQQQQKQQQSTEIIPSGISNIPKRSISHSSSTTTSSSSSGHKHSEQTSIKRQLNIQTGKSPIMDQSSPSSSGKKMKRTTQSGIPVLSPAYQRRLTTPTTISSGGGGGGDQQTKSSSNDSSGNNKTINASKSDAKLLAGYNKIIEDLMTLLLDAEDRLQQKQHDDHEKFRSANFESSLKTNESTTTTTTTMGPSTDFNQILHNRIMATIEMAEYAKMRFSEHEQFLIEISDYSGRINHAFIKGKRLIDSNSNFRTMSTTQQQQPNVAVLMDPQSKNEIVIQMNLLNQRFNDLRSAAIKHQRYLQDMLIQAQNSQLEELRTLMTKTEQKISLLIPEKMDEIPYSFQSLQQQIDTYNQLQETMDSEQQLLSAISNFVVVDSDSDGNSAISNDFVDQLDALNERWANACRITENRGKFLQKLFECWSAFDDEKKRLNDWFQRLERRLSDIEESADETLAKTTMTVQDIRFLKDIQRRLERMRTDIVYGPDQLHHRRKQQPNSVEEEEEELKSSPISKITGHSYALLKLDTKGDSRFSQKIITNIEDIGRRWETLVGQIESIENNVQDCINRYPTLMTNDDKPITIATAKMIDNHEMKSPVVDNDESTTELNKHRSKVVVNLHDSNIREWENLVDSLIKWINTTADTSNNLTIGQQEFIDLFQMMNKQSDIVAIDLIDFDLTKQSNTQQQQQQSVIEKYLKQCSPQLRQKLPQPLSSILCELSLDSDHYDDENELSSMIMVLKQEDQTLSQLQQEIKYRTTDFRQLIQRANQLCNEYESQTFHEQIEKRLTELEQCWKQLEQRIDSFRQRIRIILSLDKMHYETNQLINVLDKYRDKFEQFNKQLMMTNDNDDHQLQQQQQQQQQMQQQMEMCKISIIGKLDKVRQMNQRLNDYRKEMTNIFICWPDTDSINVWQCFRSFNFDDSMMKSLSPLQKQSIVIIIDLLRFERIVLLMKNLAESLQQRIHQVAIEYSEKEAKNENENESIVMINNRIDSPTTPTAKADKVRIAIEQFNTWLAKVINLVDEYNDDDDDDDDKDNILEQSTHDVGDRKNVVTIVNVEHHEQQSVTELQRQQQQPQPQSGSKLRSFADLANAIDGRILILADLQKTVDNEQQNYSFACRRAAEFIFAGQNDIEQKELIEIEDAIMSLNCNNYDQQTGQLISSIQSLIKRWSLLFDRFKTLLPQLEDISPSITVLETEFSQLLKFVESSDQFLDESIAIGDNESLSCQLAECSRLKQYMQGTAEENFQTIIDTAQKALKLLLGNDVFYDVIPVIRYIKQTWLSLCQRILNKLDRLEQAQKLTIDLINNLDDYRRRLNQLENESQLSAMDDRLGLNESPDYDCIDERSTSTSKSNKMTTTTTMMIYDRLIYNLPTIYLNRLKQLRDEYEQNILNGEQAIIMQMLSLITSSNGSNNNNQTLAFEQLLTQARIQIPEKMAQLQNRLEQYQHYFNYLIDSLQQLERLFDDERKFIELITDEQERLQRRQKNVEDLEDASQFMDQVEECINRCHNDEHRQSRRKQIEQIFTNDCLLDYFQHLSSISQIFDKYHIEFKSLCRFDKDFCTSLEQLIQRTDKFIGQCREADHMICKVQEWINQKSIDIINNQQDDMMLTNEFEMKRKQLLTMHNDYGEKFEKLSFNEATKRLQSKVYFVINIMDDLIKQQQQQQQQQKKQMQQPNSINETESINNKRNIIVANRNHHHHHHLAINSKMNMDSELSTLEKDLADLGSSINEMEIVFETTDNEQTIPTILERLITVNCREYETQLSGFKKRFDFIRKIAQQEKLNTFQQGRLDYLDNTRTALTKSLSFRVSVLQDLSKLCQDINDNLLRLESEADRLKLFNDGDDESKNVNLDDQMDSIEVKQNCRQILSDICALKEKLDISCIRHSDILIGIEEVGACYDELLTLVAEHYVLDDQDDLDDDHDHHDDDDNQKDSFVDEQQQQQRIIESEVKNENENENSMDVDQTIIDDNQSEQQQLKQSPVVESVVDNDDEQLIENIKITTTTELFMDTVKPLAERMINNLLLGEPDIDPGNSYSFQSYLCTLKRLEQTIECIGQRDLIELSQRRQHNPNRMFPFMLEEELYVLNKRLNQCRSQLEQLLCIATITGLITPYSGSSILTNDNHCSIHKPFDIDASANDYYANMEIEWPIDCNQMPTSSLTDDWSINIDRSIDWDRFSCQSIQLLHSLETKFDQSNHTFLTLHRHLKLIHEDTMQFNVEIRKLCDWFENVELQINNGRITMISADPNRLDESDLNMNVVARTQSLLVTQLRTHVPIYGRLKVIYERIVRHFTPEMDKNFCHYSFDLKALLDAKNRIKHEMDKVTNKWNSIVHELTWRRQCLIDIAMARSTATINGYPYRRGDDIDFDNLIKDAVRHELLLNNNNTTTTDDYHDTLPLEQLEQWLQETNDELIAIRMQTNISDSNRDSIVTLHRKLKSMEQSMAKQFMNWMLLTRQPFANKLNVANLDETGRKSLSKRFENVSINLYRLAYFVDMFITSMSNIGHMIRGQLDWLLLALEHLHCVDDYVITQQQRQSTNDMTFPIESITFLDNVRHTLINHERIIKQIEILIDELHDHCKQIQLTNCHMDHMIGEFAKIKNLYQQLVNNLRKYGLTASASIHYQMKNAYTYFNSYRQRKQQQQQQQQHQQQHNSSRSSSNSSIVKNCDCRTGNSNSNSSNNNNNNNTNWCCHCEYNPNELANYYRQSTIQLNQWLTFEIYLLDLLLIKITTKNATTTTTATTTAAAAAVLMPSNILKFTIRRAEDLLTELHFSVFILQQIWLQLSTNNEHIIIINNQSTINQQHY